MNMSYYCISDKEENKCPGYNFPSMKYITSSLEIKNEAIYVIVDSSIPQIFTQHSFIHIIGLSGSDVTFTTYDDIYYLFRDEYYIIMDSDSIEMNNFVFEGEGNITISTYTNISFVSLSKTNNFHLSLKTRQPFDYISSFIFPVHDDDIYNFDNKINVPDYTMFIGPKRFNGMFENGKFLNDEDLLWINLTVDDLREYDFNFVNYYFKGGDVEIPVTWRKPSFLSGNSFTDTNLIFSDVYSYDGALIDNFIDVSTYDHYIHHDITIKPAKYFYFDLSNIYTISDNYTMVIKIIVEKDFYMYGSEYFQSFFESYPQIYIVGKGTIKFENQKFYEKIKEKCIIDDTINLVYSSSEKHNVYACVGQSDLNKCKSKISEINSLKDYEWIWLRNFYTTYLIGSYINIEKTYFTEKLTIVETERFFLHEYHPHIYQPKNKIILTPDAELTIVSSGISVSRDNINEIYAEKSSSKIKCILYNYSYNLPEIKIDFYEPPTDIDFSAYFYDEHVKLKMKYVKDFVPNSIKIYGKSKLYIRDYLLSRTDIFQKPDSIIYIVNIINDHEQICFSEEPIEDNKLYDYFLTKSYEDFADYANFSSSPAYIYNNINFKFYSERYNFKCVTFYICNNITAKFDVPNDVLIILFDSGFNITLDKHYSFYKIDQQNRLVLNVNEFITLDVVDDAIVLPAIEFSGPEHSVDVFLFPSLRKFDQQYVINVHENLTIYSPYPQHISHLFGKTPVNFSPRWSYLYLSEEGKKFYESNPYKTFNVIDDDETLEKNIVLAAGKNDIFTIPFNWKKFHNIYIVQGEYDLSINKPTSISYQKDGLLLNDNVLIFSGKSIIFASNFTNFNIDFSKGPVFDHYPYEANIDCSLNKKTVLYVGFMNSTYFYPQNILLYGYSETSELIIHMSSEDKWRILRYIVDFYSEHYFNLRFSFDSICYYSSYVYLNGNCSENSLKVTSNSYLNKAIYENPLIPVVIGSDTDIPYTYGTHLILVPRNPFVKITLPSYPILMSVLENKTIRFEYKDSTIIDVINKSRVFVELIDNIDLNIEAVPNSTITFELRSNVLVTTQTQINYNFEISVYNIHGNLYAENLDIFGGIFGNALKQYIKVCAHDYTLESYCTFDKKENIKNVFGRTVNYHEVEIVISQPVDIILPKIYSPIKANILPISSGELTIFNPVNIFISSENTIINDYWKFDGNKKILKFKLDKTTSISITGTINDEISFELSNYESTIYLINCERQDSQIITIKKYGYGTNRLTVYGTQKSFNNFKNSLFQYSGITLIHDTTQRYLCICIDDETCEDCQDGIDGVVTIADGIISDPGENVIIRVFYQAQFSSTDLTNEHNVFIDVNSSLVLTNVDTVYQNIEEGIKFDNLWFDNNTYKNLILKPQKQGLNIFMKKYKAGPTFTIEVNKYLKLNVINVDDKDIVPSRIIAKGRGELNIFDYPRYNIDNSFYVKVIKGVYTVCEGGFCVYNSNEGYKTLGSYNNFSYDFDPDAKIIVYLYTFKDNIDANLNNLKSLKIEFNKNETKSNLNLLESQSKLRFIATTELINKDDSTTELSNSNGGAILDSEDSDLFIVGFDENLTIKQEGNLSSEIKLITIQPMNDQVSIFIDESVDIEKQKIKIETETENDKVVKVNIFKNKNIANDELLKNFIEINDNNVKVTFNDQLSTNHKKKGFPVGGIIGIVIGVIVIITIIVVVAFFLLKKKNKNTQSLSNDSNSQLDDSTF